LTEVAYEPVDTAPVARRETSWIPDTRLVRPVRVRRSLGASGHVDVPNRDEICELHADGDSEPGHDSSFPIRHEVSV